MTIKYVVWRNQGDDVTFIKEFDLARDAERVKDTLNCLVDTYRPQARVVNGQDKMDGTFKADEATARGIDPEFDWHLLHYGPAPRYSICTVSVSHAQ